MAGAVETLRRGDCPAHTRAAEFSAGVRRLVIVDGLERVEEADRLVLGER